MFTWMRKPPGEKDGMTCVACEWFYVTEKKGVMPRNAQGAFTSARPIANWLTALEALKSHDKAGYHKTALAAYAANLSQEEVTAATPKTVRQQLDKATAEVLERNLEGLVALVQLLHLNARRCHAVEEVYELAHFQAYEMGNTALRRHLSRDVTYLGHDTVRELLDCIGWVVVQDTLADIHQASWWCLMADESTDVSQVSECALAVRYVCPREHEPREVFLSMLPMRGGTSEEYQTVLVAAVRELGLPEKKMIAIGLDGTGSMSGSKRGLQARLRTELNGHAVYSWCTAHNFVLRPAKITRSVQCLDHAIQMNSTLFTWMNASALRKGDYTQFQKDNGVEKPRAVLEPHDIRWVQNHRCLQAIVAVFACLCLFMRRRQEDIHRKLTEPVMVKSIWLMADVEEANSTLVNALQGRKMTVFGVDGLFKDYVSALEGLRDSPALCGMYYSQWPDVLDEVCPGVSDDDLDFAPFHEGVAIPFLNAVIQETSKVTQSVPFMKKFYIFNPADLPEDDNARLTFGDAELNEILTYYTQPQMPRYFRGVNGDPYSECRKVEATHAGYPWDVVRIRSQYMCYKDMFSTAALRGVSILEAYKYMVREDLFKQLRVVIELFLTMPVSNAECERVISALNNTKTVFRKLMGQAMLNAQLRIALASRGKGAVVSLPGSKRERRLDKPLTRTQILRAIKRFYTHYGVKRMLQIPDHVITTVHPGE